MNAPVETDHSESGVLTLIFNRPEKKNAFNRALYESLVERLEDARTRHDVRVVLLRGAGGAFTSGNDLMDFMNDPPRGEDHVILKFLMALVDFPKPLVAAVEGPAIGIGTTMLLHCDFVYVAPSARLSLPFVKLGLVPEGGSSLLLPRLAGMVRATELLLLGEPFDGATAKEIGLANEVSEGQPVADLAFMRAEQLADRPAQAVAAAKALLREPLREQARETIVREARIFVERLTSPEAMEAFQAFFEKREPDFRRVESST